MKYSQFRQIVHYLQKFSTIKSIYRVDYQTLRVEFDGGVGIYFYMKRSNSFIYKRDEREVRGEKILSPFDTLLSQRFNRSKIEKIEVVNGDKILKIGVTVSNKYKSLSSSLQLEFTGKHTNIIILDSEDRVLEAIHHISEYQSVRAVKIGKILENPPKPNFQFREGEKIESIEQFLLEEYRNFLSQKLNNLKKREIKKVISKLRKLQKSLKEVENSEKFFERANSYREIGELILVNLYTIPKYGERIELYNFSGEKVEFERPKEARDNNHMAQIYFSLSKKFKNKGENSFIERENLGSKVDFLQRMVENIEKSETIHDVEILSNRGKEKSEKRRDRGELYEVFWIEGYKILLGKSEKGNISLLQSGKSGDIWLHMKDRPSAHTLIVTDKQRVPEDVIREAGKLCLKFSVKERGEYLIDYTQRRYVRIQSGANVLYTNYKTIAVEV
jgi:predicted ribosome quality control (RQC) complex YloA/Tae2 family protein